MLILHLSDIHFRKSEIQTAQDPNFHLRNELIRDAAQQCTRLGAPDVVVVSGDIAFSGDPEEFSFATDWLERLCGACGCSMESVFVVPGNHDVVRNLADRNLVQMIHQKIKTAPNPNAEIMRQLSDPDARRLLYESLDNYNQFAQQFFCSLLPPDRTRVVRDVALNDGSTLRLWGL
ncbi:metallophosphoesterase, partial [Escherichia coli]|nr:metallophosphoesterase [Escherichia coli]